MSKKRTKGQGTTKAQVLAYLKEEQDPRGIEHWENLAEESGGLRSYGIGLTRLRKYAKQLGTDPKLAQNLWKTPVYEAKILALLVDDPKTMTVEQAEAQVEQLHGGHLAHVFSSCDAPLAKTPFVVELLEAWIKSKDAMRRRCGYGLLYEVSKWKKKTAPTDAAFLAHIARIEKTYKKESTRVLMAMSGALMGIGKRTKTLNAAALKLARKIGPIEFDETGKCDPFDVVKHLTSDYIRGKLGL